MKIFQPVIAIGFVSLALIIRRQNKLAGKAFSRLGLLFLLSCTFVALFAPYAFDSIARIMGIGRGADLLMYVTVFSFIAFVVLVIIKIQNIESQITKIAREIALTNSRIDNK